MSSWYSSWFSGLPSFDFALPSGIQRRFFSFILKRSLGHLLKPGQLDLHQIDSQIGSGYVQVKDLELDDQAVNALLSGLPVTLHDGSISCVTARIPFPNPLTSSVGLSVQSLRLTLHVNPTNPHHPPQPNPNLADSVVSVAETFIHNELSPREEAALRESLHPGPHVEPPFNDDTGRDLPGGLDPFITNLGDEEQHGDVDPAGVSVFATFIERLLARFEFSALDTKITLVHPGQASFTLSIPEIRYGTETPETANLVRTVSISGVTLTSRSLRPLVSNSPATTPSTLSPASPTSSRYTSRPRSPSIPRSVSPASSSSSLDEETQLLMSQSLASLPPRPQLRAASPASSVTSSMYQSAISAVHGSSSISVPGARSQHLDRINTDHLRHDGTPRQGFHLGGQHGPLGSLVEEDMIMSFGVEPVVIRLKTPLLHRATSVPEEGSPVYSSSAAQQEDSPQEKERLQLSISSGVLAFALRACHVRMLLDILNILGSYSPPPPPPPSPASSTKPGLLDIGLEARMNIRGIAILLIPVTSITSQHLEEFYARPLKPPMWPFGYVRALLENISGSLVLPGIHSEGSQSAGGLVGGGAQATGPSTSKSSPPVSASLALAEMSIFAFHAVSPTVPRTAEPSASPVLITDPHLINQYSIRQSRPPFSGASKQGRPPSDMQLATFDAVDWTLSKHVTGSAKLSTWRTRPKHVPSRSSDHDIAPAVSVVVQGPPMAARPRSNSATRTVEVQIAPLHFFVDLGIMLDEGNLLPFVEEIMSVDNLSRPPVGSDQRDQRPAVLVGLPMIRVEVRCPPPPLRSPRSGSLILDLQNIRVSNKSFERAKPALKFSDASSTPAHSRGSSTRSELLAAQCQRVVMAYSSAGSTKATVFLTLGSLPAVEGMASGGGYPGKSTLLSVEPPQSSLPLRILLAQSSQDAAGNSRATGTTVTVDVPLVNAILSKDIFDGLQQWADDVSQIMERSLNKFGETDTEKALSRDPSLIGSRAPCANTLPSALIRVLLPRADEASNAVRPFDVHASDLDMLLELKPEGKDETVVTASVLDLGITDATINGETVPLLSLSAPRSLSSVPKPMVKVTFTSFVVPETTAKESKIRLTLWGFTFHALPDMQWTSDLGRFAKAPPGVFESVVPSERTRIAICIMDSSIKATASRHSGAAVLHIGATDLSTELVGNSTELGFKLSIPSISLLFVDSLSDVSEDNGIDTAKRRGSDNLGIWKSAGYALITEIVNLDLSCKIDSSSIPSDTRIILNRLGLRIHICADTLAAVTGFISDLTAGPNPSVPEPPRAPVKKAPAAIIEYSTTRNMMGSVDEEAFRKVPEVGTMPDMISDDLPSNLDYLDASFGTAAGLRELRDDDLDDFDTEEASGRTTPTTGHKIGVVSNVGGETIKINRPLKFVDNYYDTLGPGHAEDVEQYGDTTLRIRVHSCDITLFLYDGYDWARTRKIIEQEVKDMRRRLAKIRQLVATGQTQDPDMEETSALLFNSMHIGLDRDLDDLEPGALIAAIDEELNDNFETDTQSSWQSLHPASPGQPHTRSPRVHGRRLTRSKGPSIEIRLSSLDAEVDHYRPGEAMVSRTLAVVKDLEILDHIKTSTWRKFLTDLRADSRGNVRETDSNMVRVELRTVRPSPSHPSEEARLRAKILPLRLYVDQDALDFLKKFFSFKDPESPASAPADTSSEEIYFQHAEVFPVDIKLDYKPRRVDYRALREGKTIELMNFFHFDGSEMTLRHLTLHGITGWPRFFDRLNDLWTPDVKATQLVDVISGVSPIRSVVNVGSGVADLVLLPIAQYKKDGRIVRGVQKGTKSFVQSTAMEAIKLGARLATGTQVILEQAEGVLGGQFKDSVTAETLQIPYEDDLTENDDDDLISRYAEQPTGVTEGVQSAYRSLQKNFNSAAQTILAVPMEVYERSGNEGAVRAVIRAVPIAVLKPMIGASEAVSKTLMGLHNTLDPNVRHENEAKYKQR
ncbi:putative peripheral membrane protein [Leucogyrophana mollusca]|uniref:Peripheral membrane protein n=1 Tax=Leucogyrophana mollusca TaxID=85980 RepID=A0ACB8B8W2_9AGAM|nr:putative peripheral membrane protein [Leucogyrophana mollusca]